MGKLAHRQIDHHLQDTLCRLGVSPSLVSRLQFVEYLRTLSLKFQKAQTKIEVVLTLPGWLSQHTPETVLVSIS